jgi:hypothetical protein
MARPIRETPVLSGDDALRFTEEMQRVEQIPVAERKQNRMRLESACRSFMNHLTVLI